MPVTGRAKAGRPKGARRTSASSQLSELQRNILMRLRQMELDMLGGDEGQHLEARNMGVPWSAGDMAKLFCKQPQAISRALSNLEDRRLVCCFATGVGNGRRVLHVKLSAEAVAVADHQLEYGMSEYQRKREISRTAGDLRTAIEAGRLEDGLKKLLKGDPDYGHIVES